MPNIENLKNQSNFSRSEKFNRIIPTTLDREQLEYTSKNLLLYGTILFAVVLGIGSVTYMTIQQLKK